MIKFVNPELFNTETSVIENDNRAPRIKTVYKAAICAKNQKTKVDEHRILITSLSDKDYDFTDPECDYKASIRSTATKTGGTRVNISISEKNKFDTPIYLVAIPFNGLLQKIEPSFQYRIYRAFVVKSEKRDISWNNGAYKKIAYMVVVPNTAMFDENHKYHTDMIALSVTSYNIEQNHDGEKFTVKEDITVEFNPDGTTTQVVDNDVVDPVDPEDFVGGSYFPIFRPRSNEGKRDSNHNRNHSKEDSKPVDPDSLEKMINEFNKKSSDRQPKYKNNARNKKKRK